MKHGTTSDGSSKPLPPEHEAQAYLTGQFHTPLVQAFLTGITTPITALVIYISYKQPAKRTPVIAVILLQYCIVSACVIYKGDQFVQAFMLNSRSLFIESFYYPSVTDAIINDTGLFLSMIIADGLIIWRVWNVWSRNLYIVGPLALLAISEAGLLFYCLHLDIVVTPLPPSDTETRLQNLDVVLFIAALVLGVIVTAVASLLIILRIYMVGGRTRGIAKYKIVVEVILESAALYTAPLLASLIDGFAEALSESVFGFVIDGVSLVTTWVQTMTRSTVPAHPAVSRRARPVRVPIGTKSVKSFRIGNHCCSIYCMYLRPSRWAGIAVPESGEGTGAASGTGVTNAQGERAEEMVELLSRPRQGTEEGKESCDASITLAPGVSSTI